MKITSEALTGIAGALTALTVIGGALWWLLWPRIEDRLQEVVRGLTAVHHQLDPDGLDTVAQDARKAAEAAMALPEINAQLSELNDWRRQVDRRLGHVEGALIALLGPELRKRLTGDLD